MIVARGPALLLLVCAAATSACEKKPGAGRADDVETRAAQPPKDHTPKVHLVAADGTEQTVRVEVVREEQELQRGLMHRRHLDADAGMLFLMGDEDVHTFWMRNTYIPLDMIFIGKDLTVAGIVEDTVPHSEELRSVDKPSLYVLEVNAGWSRKHGVGPGAKVRFENVRGL